MTRRKTSFADWVGLVRHLVDQQWEDGGIAGTLTVLDEDMRGLLAYVFAHSDDFPCQVVDGDIDSVAVGDVFRLIFGRPRLGIGYLFQNTAEWLRNGDVRCGRLDRWYIADLNWMSGEPNEQLGDAYGAILKLISVLEISAAVVDKANAILVFLPGERLDIPVDFGQEELCALDVASAKEIVALASMEDGHAKQRREILATAICDLVRDNPEAVRFAHLLKHLEELTKRFKDGYSLFASSFSFEKVRDQMEALRVDYTSKIHKALSDIQGQLLGIPISTIVVATQMKDAPTPGALMWGNIAVLLGAFVFVALLFLALRNQWHTLDVLAAEIRRQEQVTEKDYANIAPRFFEVFSCLKDRLWHQRVILLVIGAVCLIGLGLAYIIFWALTAPALRVFF